MNQKKITIKEIAEKANVSIATVSRVINDYKWVTPEVRERVRAIMREFNYCPNYNAAAMGRGNSKTIVIVVPTIENPFFATFVSVAMRVLREEGFISLVYETGNKEEEEIRLWSGPIGQMADGIISVTDILKEEVIEDLFEKYEAQGKSVIFVDLDIPVSKFDSIVHDNIGAVNDVVDCFVKAGHRKIAMILGKTGESVRIDKIVGYRQGLKRNEIPFRAEYLCQGKWGRETGQKEANRLLDLEDRPTAIFAANNYISRGVLDVLFERGLKPGLDISLIGTEECGQDVLDFEKMGITNLRLESEKLAIQASQSILKNLDKNAGTQHNDTTHSKTVFKMKLIERSSVVRLK